MSDGRCHCGLPLHYIRPYSKALVEHCVKQYGPYVPITTGTGRTFLVQRHYLALHGIKEDELPRLGFTEITLARGNDGR